MAKGGKLYDIYGCEVKLKDLLIDDFGHTIGRDLIKQCQVIAPRQYGDNFEEEAEWTVKFNTVYRTLRMEYRTEQGAHEAYADALDIIKVGE